MTKTRKYIPATLFLTGLIFLSLGITAKIRNSAEEHLSNEKDGLFFVVSYNTAKGTIDKQVLCDYVRKNPEKHEVVCREWKTNEYYIFSYPVSMTDVTLAKDYIKFTNEK